MKRGWLRDRERCSSSHRSPTISCRSALSSRGPSSRRTSPSSTRHDATASSSRRTSTDRRTSSSRPAHGRTRSSTRRVVLGALAQPRARRASARGGHTTSRTRRGLVLRSPRGRATGASTTATDAFRACPRGRPRPALAALHAAPCRRRRGRAAGRRPDVGAGASRAVARELLLDRAPEPRTSSRDCRRAALCERLRDAAQTGRATTRSSTATCDGTTAWWSRARVAAQNTRPPRRLGARRAAARPASTSGRFSPSTWASGSDRSRSWSRPIPVGFVAHATFRCGTCSPQSTPSGRRTGAPAARAPTLQR